ncbi:hypothetical protein D9619_009858 [Psilocybe cf. subviscida]|uniref:2-dehydropantoate 2-reductase n=1 Tax=Psilocybe cf. subviscida TaxID=2480587 RepID=A0A8H5BLX6_9AGAR|nr:hypothetical protein D9619_009858 [Psilocybe cf. subviscida]
MASHVKDILLVGSGAVGAIYALVLKQSGLARVTAVARSNYSLIEKEGIHFQSGKYGNISGWMPDRLCRSVAEAADRHYSYVMITTKSVPEVMKTSTILAPFLSPEYTSRFPQPTYVFLQNGLNVEGDTYHAVKALGKGEPSIVTSALYIGTNLNAPNVVEHNDFNRLALGVYRHENYTATENSPEEASLLQDIGNILEKGGATISIVPEIQRVKFSKNFWNVAFSSIATLTQYTLPAIFRSPPRYSSESYTPYVSDTTADLINAFTIPTITAIMEEMLAVGRALGFPDSPEGLPSSSVSGTLERTRVLHITADSIHVPSMLLDARQRRPIEVEVIVGEVVRMARAHNVPVPRIETLYALLLVVQNQILREMESKTTRVPIHGE